MYKNKCIICDSGKVTFFMNCFFLNGISIPIVTITQPIIYRLFEIPTSSTSSVLIFVHRELVSHFFTKTEILFYLLSTIPSSIFVPNYLYFSTINHISKRWNSVVILVTPSPINSQPSAHSSPDSPRRPLNATHGWNS